MSAAPLGFGIIGTGMIAGTHAQAIAAVNGARLIGVMGRTRQKAEALAKTHGAVFATDSLQELVNHPEIQVVCVTTPSGAHLEPALAAIAGGKHVIIEKPLEITPERADRIIAAADAKGVILAPIFQARFGEGARRVKAALEAGRLGRSVIASVSVKWHRTAAYYSGWKGTLDLDGGGALINQSIHGLDLLQWFVGLPEEVFCWTTRRVHAGIQAEDTASAVLRFPDGALGTVEATTATWPGWSRRIELCGENGSIALEDDRVVRWEIRSDETTSASGGSSNLGSGASAPNAITHVGHQLQIQDLVDAVAAGRAPAIDGREGRRAVALVHALYRSAESGRPEKVDSSCS